MRRVLVAALVAMPASAFGAPAPSQAGIPVARLSFIERVVEQASPGQAFKRAKEGDRIHTGDRIRVAAEALARIDFPWMTLTAAPGSVLSVSPSAVLAIVLEQGRVELRAEGREIVKLVTEEAQIRGEGRVVVRRADDKTLVSSMDGIFRVEAAGRIVELGQGEGTTVASKRPPSAAAEIPRAPVEIWPGLDPVYTEAGREIAVRWKGDGAAYHLELLPLDSDEVLIARDVGPPPASLVVPWVGTFRWRVAQRDPRGLEGMPSAAGLICVVDQ
jgi:hypothetical protein